MLFRSLESAVAAELERLLRECPGTDEVGQTGQESAHELTAIDRKIGRLIDALAESSDLSMGYINRAIQELERQRQELLDRQAKGRARTLERKRLRFEPLSFEEKKLVAAQFIQEIRLEQDTAAVIWNV